MPSLSSSSVSSSNSSSAEAASAISLVVNELVQNAVKHAFPAGRAGVILIELIKTPLFSRISVRDNGVGMDPDRAEGDTLGLGLVRTMVREKLNGELRAQAGAPAPYWM